MSADTQDTETTELIGEINEYMGAEENTGAEDAAEESEEQDDSGDEAQAPEADESEVNEEEESEVSDADDDSASGGEEDSGDDEDELQAKSFDTGLIYQASQVGLTQDEVDQCGGNDDLLKRINQKAFELLKAKDEPDTDDTAEGAKDGETEFKPFELDLSEFDEDLSKKIGGFVEYANGMGKELAESRKVIAELKEAVAGFSSGSQQQQTQQVMDTFDSALDGIAEMKEVFGQGVPKQGTKEFANRGKVYDEFEALVQVDRQRGRNTSLEDLAKKAAQSVFSKEYESAKEKQLKEKALKRLKKRGSMKQEPPHNSTDEQAKDPDRAAIDAANEVLRRMDI